MHFGALQTKLRGGRAREHLRVEEIPLNNGTSKTHLDRSAECDGVREARLVMYRLLTKKKEKNSFPP